MDYLEQFKSREDFDRFWQENYVPVAYEDVKADYDQFIKDHEKKIFLADYQEKNCISRKDFMENLHEDSAFMFQDTLTEIFYDKNPEIYEAAFALFEAAEMEGHKETVAATFHETFEKLYVEFLLRMFEENYGGEEASEE